MYLFNLRLNRSLLVAPIFIVLLTVSGLSFLAPAAAQPPAPVSPQVVPTQMSGYKVLGPLAPSADVYVTFGIPLRNLQYLESLEQQISTPGSSMYRQYLSQAEIEQNFLPTAQYNQVLSFLNGHGFTIVTSALDSIIVAQGTEAQASEALGLHYDMYSNGSYAYYSASGVSPISGVYLYSSNVTAVLLAHPPTLMSTAALTDATSGSSQQPNQTAPFTGYPTTDLSSTYNATGLLSKGITGTGYTAGVLDFAGAPLIQQQLAYYDQEFGLPNTDLTVIPVGPYNPSTGPLLGWDIEISIDVESVHTMAPGADIDLYIADNALPIAAPIAQIVQDDKVNDLSQSFGYSEAILSQLGSSMLDLNVILTDQYYLLGSAEGITFTAASGDRGGSGPSGSPEGTPLYPSSSPYVVSVGGTATYINSDGPSLSSYQTAWSNYGFTPYNANYGGSSGGVSILEPKPWYQSGLSVPSSFPDGRLTPDVALNAGYPTATFVFPGNVTGPQGGTSEASPLLAGLLTLVMQSSKSSLGLINPSLYSLGASASTYSKVYTPITFGYTIPWVESAGYNFITGWGAPNIGEMAKYGLTGPRTSSLSIYVNATASGTPQFEFAPGAVVQVAALVTSGTTLVKTGTFTAELQALSGTTGNAKLTFNTKTDEWTGSLTVPDNASGLTYVTVNGVSGSSSGTGFSEIFAGYVATYLSPVTNFSAEGPYSYSSNFAIPINVNITTLAGAPIENGSYSVTISSYSLASNTYSPVVTIPLTYGESDFGVMWNALLNGSYPDGPMMINAGGGAYGYVPFINGASLEPAVVLPSVVAEPGAVGPGQTIFITATIQAPINLPPVESYTTGLPISYDVMFGSNVTATLVSPTNVTVSTANLYYNDFVSATSQIQGYLQVPESAAAGLYTLTLRSNLNSLTLGTNVSGVYSEQIYIAPTTVVPQVSITPSLLYEGQNAIVSAKIDYPNGTAIKYGMYAATLYPQSVSNLYTEAAQDVQVPLEYDASSGLWVGTMTLPSALNGGSVDFDVGAVYYSGPYDAYVFGISADGVPTTTAISAQQGFLIQPYLWVSGQNLGSFPQTSGVAFSGDNITSSATLANDLFQGSNSITGGPVTIIDSQINGTLNVDNAQVILVGVTGGTIVAQNSKVTLDQSSITSLQLSASQVSINASTFQQVTPSLPTISVQTPAPGLNYNGTSGTITVSGQGISSVSVSVDGKLLTTLTGASPYTFQLPASSLQDGVHSLQVVATQQDGLSASSFVYFTTNGQLTAADNDIGSLNSSLSSAQSSISSASASMNNLDSKLNSADSTITNLTYGLYVLGLVAVVALGIAIVAMTRRGPSQRDASSGSPTEPQAAAPAPPTPPVTGGTEPPPPSSSEPAPQPQ